MHTLETSFTWTPFSRGSADYLQMSEYIHNEIFLQNEKEQLSPAKPIMYWLNNEIVVGSLSTVLAPYAAILSESRSGSFSTGCVSIIVSCITAINYPHTVRHAIISNLMISIVYNIFSL